MEPAYIFITGASILIGIAIYMLIKLWQRRVYKTFIEHSDEDLLEDEPQEEEEEETTWADTMPDAIVLNITKEDFDNHTDFFDCERCLIGCALKRQYSRLFDRLLVGNQSVMLHKGLNHVYYTIVGGFDIRDYYEVMDTKQPFTIILRKH